MTQTVQITEVGLGARAVLIDTLVDGFPLRSRSEWERFIQRAGSVLDNKDLPASADGQGPRLGWLLGDPDKPDGVLLGLPNPMLRLADNGQAQQINMSSWYVRDEKRAQALWMLRKISNLPGHTFTDLTPSIAVEKMLPSLGYRPIATGIVSVYTPQGLLMSNKGWEVIDAQQAIDRQTDPRLTQALTDHQGLGCLVLGLVRKEVCLPVVMVRSSRRRVIRTAEAVYLPPNPSGSDNSRSFLPALARWLAIRGILMLDLERPIDTDAVSAMRQKIISERPRFVRGPYPENSINHLYSELVFATK